MAESKSSWGQLVRVILSPVNAFAALAESGSWVPPFVASGVTGMVLALVSAPKAVEVTVATQMKVFAAMEAAGRMPQGQVNADQLATFTKIGVYLAGVFLPWIMPLLLGLLVGALLLAVSAAGKDGLSFGKLFGLGVWAYWPVALVQGLLQTAYTASMPVDQLALTSGQLRTSLAMLLPLTTHRGGAFALLSLVDVMTIWGAVLVGIGYAAFARKGGARAVMAGLVYYVAGAAWIMLQVYNFSRLPD